MPSTVRVDKELADALQDVRDTSHEYGDDIVFTLNYEAAATRDKYNSIKSVNTPTSTVTTTAHPANFNPTDRDYEKAGIRKQGECIVYTPAKDWIDAGIDFHAIDLVRTRAAIQGRTYEVIDKNIVGQIGQGYVNYVFSLKTR